MEDGDVCPLCCEDLDISDQQFFPCKCGYQVCMWCWHRIKETESGLCPACRTPYGDDPHEFSAVDMEEVVKANKAKAAAEKRERERLRQEQAGNAAGAGPGRGAHNLGNMHIGGGSDGDHAVAMSSKRGHEPPKDRNQLANMRVIRRNLVYAVGLPPSVASEDTLRKPEFFGQYGKIAKIVINRNHPGNTGDPKRATASAYITFVHPEDTLACILALDGTYHEGRTIRCSFGTSKYCSAFIKNVRCNNPDCTYLHCMGDAEDTFTKQAIQAGYVTSGRDVLEKQKMMAQNSGARKRVGGGGPSGTGRASANPVFPPPTYEAPPRQSTALVNAPGAFPQIGNPSLNRSASASVTGFSSVAAGTLSPSAAAAKAAGPARSVSMSAATPAVSTPATAVVTGLPTAGSKGGKKKAQKAKEQAKANGPKPSANSAAAAAAPATAASVVAGLRTTKSKPTQPPPAHATLTPLTPLNKKGGGTKSASSSVGGGKSVNTATSGNSSKGHNRNDSLPDTVTLPTGVPASSSRKHGAKLGAVKTGGDLPVAGSIPAATTPLGVSGNSAAPGVGAIGGTILGGGGSEARAPVGPPIGSAIGPPGGLGSATDGGLDTIGGGSLLSGGGGGGGGFGFGSLGGTPLGGQPLGGQSLGGQSLGGQPLGGQPLGGQPLGMSLGQGSAIGPSSNGTSSMSGSLLPPVGGGRAIGPNGGSAPGGGVIGGGTIGNNPFASNSPHGNSGSSALASMLGIQLPTGSGSLSETPSLWGSSPAAPLSSPAPAPIPIGGPSHPAPGPIVGLAKAPGAPSGGLAIGGGMPSANSGGVPIGGFHGNGTSATAAGSNSNDIALLQSLLPGVRVTSGSDSNQPTIGSASIGGAVIGGGSSTDWGTSIGGPPQQQLGGIGSTQSSVPIGGLGGGLQQQSTHQHQQGLGGGDPWGSSGLYGGTIGGSQTSQQQQQQQRSNIW